MKCTYCKDTGTHLSPDVAEPVVVNCTNKRCSADITLLKDLVEAFYGQSEIPKTSIVFKTKMKNAIICLREAGIYLPKYKDFKNKIRAAKATPEPPQAPTTFESGKYYKYIGPNKNFPDDIFLCLQSTVPQKHWSGRFYFKNMYTGHSEEMDSSFRREEFEEVKYETHSE